MKLPHGERAIVDIEKLIDYCLSPEHPRGKHKARVFLSACGITPEHAELLRQQLLQAAAEGEATSQAEIGFGPQLCDRMEYLRSHGHGPGSCAPRKISRDSFPHLSTRIIAMSEPIELLDVVALASDLPEHHLVRGQVGTVVEVLSPGVFEIEFSDDQGRTYAMLPLQGEQLIVLHTSPAQAS